MAFIVEDRMVIKTRKRALAPRDEWIVIRATDPDVTDGGLVIPGTSEAYKKMLVVAVGPGKLLEDGTRRPMTVRLNDWVVVRQGCAFGNDITGEVVFLAREDDVICTVVNAETA